MPRETDPSPHLFVAKKDTTLELPTPPQSAADRHLWQIVGIRDVFLIGTVLFLIWFGYYLRGVFTPVLIALLLAYLVHPFITYAEERWRIPRPVTVTVVLVTMTLFVIGFRSMAGSAAYRSSTNSCEKGAAVYGERRREIWNWTR